MVAQRVQTRGRKSLGSGPTTETRQPCPRTQRENRRRGSGRCCSCSPVPRLSLAPGTSQPRG